jgi:hypothetical protein
MFQGLKLDLLPLLCVVFVRERIDRSDGRLQRQLIRLARGTTGTFTPSLWIESHACFPANLIWKTYQFLEEFFLELLASILLLLVLIDVHFCFVSLCNVDCRGSVI